MGPLFAPAERKRRLAAMQACIDDAVPPKALRNRSDRWWSDIKASDDVLDGVFASYFERLGLPILMRKSDYHELARLVLAEDIDREVAEKLDLIVAARGRAKPRSDAN